MSNVHAGIVSPRSLGRKARALIIERQAAFVPFLRDALERAGYGQVVTSRCVSARILDRLRPDTIVLGPGAASRRPLEAIRRLRQRASEARIVVIAYREDPAWNALARALGADVVLGPNDDGAALFAAIGACPGRKETPRIRRTT